MISGCDEVLMPGVEVRPRSCRSCSPASWRGDLHAPVGNAEFIHQFLGRGFRGVRPRRCRAFKKSTVVLTAGETAMFKPLIRSDGTSSARAACTAVLALASS
jgi:hypothetical protein